MRRSNFLNLTDEELDKPIYRIIKKEYLFDLFASGQNLLRNPGLWDDPYENLILKSKVQNSKGEITDYGFHEFMYGQCWSLHKASDAMWRIYSPEADGIRLRTTVRKLAHSLYDSGVFKPEATAYIGKVRYLSTKKIWKFSNTLYDEDSFLVDNLFYSLLVKRPAFKHEREVRLLYSDVTKKHTGDEYLYPVDPHALIDQLMIDPRVTYDEFKLIKQEISDKTGYKGSIKRSLLYAPPEDMIIVTKAP